MIYIKPIAEVLQRRDSELGFPPRKRVHVLTINPIEETNMHADKLDTLGQKLADTALTLLVRLYPEVRQASTAELDAACAAMRESSRSVIDQLIDDAKDAPGVAHIAFQTAALTLAHEGIQTLKAGRK